MNLSDSLVSQSGLRTGLFGPSTPAFSARSWATNLKSRPSLGHLVLACGMTYQRVSKTSPFKVGMCSACLNPCYGANDNDGR